MRPQTIPPELQNELMTPAQSRIHCAANALMTRHPKAETAGKLADLIQANSQNPDDLLWIPRLQLVCAATRAIDGGRTSDFARLILVMPESMRERMPKQLVFRAANASLRDFRTINQTTPPGAEAGHPLQVFRALAMLTLLPQTRMKQPVINAFHRNFIPILRDKPAQVPAIEAMVAEFPALEAMASRMKQSTSSRYRKAAGLSSFPA